MFYNLKLIDFYHIHISKWKSFKWTLPIITIIGRKKNKFHADIFKKFYPVYSFKKNWIEARLCRGEHTIIKVKRVLYAYAKKFSLSFILIIKLRQYL